MKASSLLNVLCNFENAVAVLTGSDAIRPLNALRPLFAGHEDDSVAVFLNALIKLRDVHGVRSGSVPLTQARDTLLSLEKVLRSAEGKKGADDVAKLAQLLEGCGQPSVSAFVSEARGWLEEGSKPKPKSERPSRKKPSASAVPTLRPDEYAKLLKEAFRDNAQFDDLIARLRGDKKIKKPNMREVARLVLGFELAKKNGREDAVKAIVERQRIEARQQARGSVLDRLKPW
jgi:hypothetical protein